MRPHRHLGAALLLALLAGCAALAGCRAGGHPAAAASPSTMSDAQILDIGRQHVQCLREHGLPNFPDPVVQNGELKMGSDPSGGDPKQALQNNPAAVEACQSILDRLPPAPRRNDPTPSAQELQAMMQFSACMREHGVPEYPDALPNGSFPLPTPLHDEGKSQRVLAGLDACRHFLPAEQQGGGK